MPLMTPEQMVSIEGEQRLDGMWREGQLASQAHRRRTPNDFPYREGGSSCHQCRHWKNLHCQMKKTGELKHESISEAVSCMPCQRGWFLRQKKSHLQSDLSCQDVNAVSRSSKDATIIQDVVFLEQRWQGGVRRFPDARADNGRPAHTADQVAVHFRPEAHAAEDANLTFF